jgi:putative membrane protein
MTSFQEFVEVIDSIRRFHRSQTIKSLMIRLLWFGLYTFIVVFVEMTVMRLNVTIDTIFLTLLGTLLSLLLVFRTNTAYDRFWEGRKQWGTLVNNSRSLAMTLNAALPRDDAESRRYFARYLAAFAFALKGHLRDEVRFHELEDVSEADMTLFRSVKHVPNQVATLLLERMQELCNASVISSFDMLNAKPHHHALVDVTGACERIKRTPLPYSYNFYIKLFISAYICVIPFMLIDKYGYYTVIAVMLVSYALMGIEMIACEIEEPFGYDANDLPLDQMALTIKMNVYEILGVEPPASTEEQSLTLRQ